MCVWRVFVTFCLLFHVFVWMLFACFFFQPAYMDIVHALGATASKTTAGRSINRPIIQIHGSVHDPDTIVLSREGNIHLLCLRRWQVCLCRCTFTCRPNHNVSHSFRVPQPSTQATELPRFFEVHHDEPHHSVHRVQLHRRLPQRNPLGVDDDAAARC